MTKYIDRDALLEKLSNSSETWAKNIENIHNWWPHTVRIKDNIVAEIKRQPVADVEEVKHGRWKFNKDGSGTCNQCNFTQVAVWDFDRWQNFCGVCGAKMDGEKER